MYVFRFMSSKEFEKFQSGETLTNTKFHGAMHASKAIGFCFLELNELDDIPYCFSFLTGIVSEDVLVIFKAPREIFKKSLGRFSDINSSDFFSTILCPEYSLTQYSPANLELVSYTTSWDDSVDPGKYPWVKPLPKDFDKILQKGEL